MSTRLTGYSGSRTSASAARTRASVVIGSGRQRSPLEPSSLDHLDELLVRRPALAPALLHLVPGDLALLEEPPLLLLVELRREWAVDHERALRGVVVSRHADPDRLAERDRGRHPLLPELVVRHALQAVVDLLAVPLEVVRKPEPLEGHEEHPVDRRLERVARGGISGQRLHPAL